MQSLSKIIFFSAAFALSFGLTGCVGNIDSAPIISIHDFGVIQPENSTPVQTAAPADLDDEETQGMAEAKHSAETSKPPQLIFEPQTSQNPAPAVKKETPFSAPVRSTKPTIQPVSPQALSVHRPVEGELVSEEAGIAKIKTTPGSSVKSVVNGTVIYTGPSVQGAGSMVIVKDDQGTLFAYSHLEKVSVDEGNSVQSGTVLGKTSRDLLLFQVRKSGGVVDSKTYL